MSNEKTTDIVSGEACLTCDSATKLSDCPCVKCAETTDEACVDCPYDHSRCKWMVQ